MRYVDLRKRRQELARKRRYTAAFSYGVEHAALLSIAAGLALGVSGLIVFHTTSSYDTPFTPPPGEPFLWALPLWFLAIAFLVLGVRQLRHQPPQGNGPTIRAEKQLLMAIRAGGGCITPIQAALETSLTVDEAEELLSRLANHGHLHVESRNGTLYYLLPGHYSS